MPGQRVMQGVSQFITSKLKLKVNTSKSAVARPKDRKFLSFSFTSGKKVKRRIAPKAIERFKAKVRILTNRHQGRSLRQIVLALGEYLRGWRGYFGNCQTPSVLAALDEWTRRRLRALVWKQWRHGPTRFAELRRCGVGRDQAAQAAGSPRGPWRLSSSPALAIALSNASLESLGLATVAAPKPLYLSNRRIRTRMYGGVGGEES